MKFKHLAIPVVLVLLAAPAFSQELGFRGWGPRAGFTSDPDQVFGGVHFNLGEFAPHLRFQPNVEFASGDDFRILSVTAPVHYRFDVEGNITPYAGGGVTFAFVDADLPGGGDDSDFEIAGKAIGGVEWALRSNDAFFLELNVGAGDIPEVLVLAGWTFGAGARSPKPAAP